ncbi:hypothetical protein AB205_0168200, partial [Aquarana catesbeiana]
MIFAIDEITKSSAILPNITLGFQAYDSCMVIQQSLEGALHAVTGRGMVVPNYQCFLGVPLSAIIGHSTSTHSILLAQVLGLLWYPQISNFATSPFLSDKQKFPSFFRTVPSDAFQSRGVAQLLLHFGWMWVGLVGVDNDYGLQGIQLVRQEIIKAGACVAFTENLISRQSDRNVPHIAKVIKKSTAMVVVVFSRDLDFAMIVAEMMRQNVTQRVFVASEAWSTSTIFSTKSLAQFVTGTIGLALHRGTIMGFKEFLNKIHPSLPWGGKWVKILWEKTFTCALLDQSNITTVPSTSVKYCTGNESLENIQNSFTDISNLRVTYSAYMAVHVVAKALEDLRTCYNIKNLYVNKICSNIFNFRPFEHKNLKRRDSVGCLKCSWDHWPDPQKSMCLPKTIEYLSYEDPLGATLAGITIVSSLVPNIILRLFVLHRNSPLVKANNYRLSCLLLLSLLLCFFCSLIFIGPPQRETCLLRQSAFGMVFTLCVSCILAKTIMVVFAFMATKPGSKLRIWTSPWVSFLIIFICSLLQLTLCIFWLSLAPPFPKLSTGTESRIISFECNEGSAIAFWAMLGYLSLLAFISFTVAFLSRGLPDSFNEAQYITFSMLAFLSVWISFIPAYFSAQGKYTVAMEIFAILSSSWALLICMFFPKCFIILFRPDMNSREYLFRKGKPLSN